MLIKQVLLLDFTCRTFFWCADIGDPSIGVLPQGHYHNTMSNQQLQTYKKITVNPSMGF